MDHILLSIGPPLQI